MRAPGRLLSLTAVLVTAGCEKAPDQTARIDSSTATPATAPRQPPEYWAARLRNPAAQDRREALGMLGEQGRAASSYAPLVVPLLGDPDAPTGFTAAWALAHMGMAAHPLLIDRLESGDARVRERAAYGVGEAGPAAASAIERLRALERDPDPAVRSMAGWAITQVAGRGMVADQNLLLLEGLDGTLEQRLEGIKRLGVSARQSRVAVRELIGLLGDSVPQIREAAMTALADIGPIALPSLSVALSHRNRQIRANAILVIARLRRSI